MEQVLESVVVGFGNLGSLKRVMMLLLGHWDSLAMCHPNVLHSITRLAGKRGLYMRSSLRSLDIALGFISGKDLP